MVKRVLVFSTDDHLYPAGGAEQAFGNISERMPDVEFDLICAKLRKGVKGFERVKNVNIYRMGFGMPIIDSIVLALFGHFCAYKLMRTHTYDLIWSIMASYGAFAAVRVKKKTHIPFLLTLQEGDAFEHIYARVKYVRKSFNEIFQLADGLQAISKYLLTWGKEMGFRGADAKVIPNGVDVDVYLREYSLEEIARVRNAFGFEAGSTILITSSRLEKKNGVADVITALSKLPPKVCFVICGSGSLESELKAQVKQLDLSSRVTFLGFVDPSELPLLMKASDIFIRPSLTEGLGIAFLEGMAAIGIIVGTPVGGIPDFLTDGKTGFMVTVEDPDSIKMVIEKIMSLSESEKGLVRREAQSVIREVYNWDIVTRHMQELFDDITRSHERTHS